MRTFADIMRKNPAKVNKIIVQNTRTNEYGDTTIARDDTWVTEDVWDADYERVKDADRYRGTYRAAD